MGGTIVIGVVGIMRVAIVVSMRRFVRGVCVCKREHESGGRTLAADFRSILKRGRDVAGAVVGCADGLVLMGVFVTGCVGGLGTDGGLDAGEFMAEGCFGV